MCVQRAAESSSENSLVSSQGLGDLRQELKAFVRLAAPSFTHSILAFGMTSVVLISIGRLGALQLSIASLASSFFYLTGASIVIGLTMGIDTLCGQANGAGNRKMVHSTLRRALCVCSVASMIVSLIWTRSEWIFLKLGQNPNISKQAAFYLQLMIPYLFLDVSFTCYSKFLTCQGIVKPMTIASLLSILVVPFLSWILIFKTNLGLYGAPSTLFLVSLLAISTLIFLKGDTESSMKVSSLSEWLKDGFSQWREYLSTSLPGLATICSEWWCYELFTILAGILPAAELTLGVMGASNSVINILFVAAIALSSASSVRVSNFVGAGLKKSAKQSAWTGLTLIFVLETFLLISVCFCSKLISKIWFTEPKARALCVSILPLVAFTEWGSGISYVLFGILRACNRIPYGMVANLIAYWCIGVPLGIFLGFHSKLGIQGFWIGLATAANIQSMILLFLFFRLDFDVEIKRAKSLTKLNYFDV